MARLTTESTGAVSFTLLSRLPDHVRDPPGRLADLVVDARLLLHGAPEAGRGDADQGPPTVEVDDWKGGN